jgi:hypothetical protein
MNMFRSSTRSGEQPAAERHWALLAASLAGLIVGRTLSWPLWAMTVSVALPWLPLFARSIAQTYRPHPWLGFFCILTWLQLSHLGEHVVQMVQIHGLGLQGEDARGVFGVFDIEWVHFIWNVGVLVGVLLLLARSPRNRWLQVTAVISAWHAVEHSYILTVYLSTGLSGTPGLLASGGLIGGGLPLSRPDLHFLYNLIESAPLVLAFVGATRTWQAPNGRPILQRVSAYQSARR